jgi:hypothetical protein
VEDVHVRSGSVTGNDHVGGVVASLGIYVEAAATPKTVSRCSNAANISGHFSVGGVVGDAPAYAGGTPTIISCYNTGNITGTTAVGGVVGYLSTSSLIACYNTGDVTGSVGASQGVGGVAGINNYGDVIACYNTGTVSGKGEYEEPGDLAIAGVGGVVGCKWGGSVTACYNTGEVIRSSGPGTNVASVVGMGGGDLTSSANYWKSGTAANGGLGGGEPDTTIPFSGTAWPSAGSGSGQNAEWGAGDGSGSGKYWKALGGWNGGSPVYPKLWYEP